MTTKNAQADDIHSTDGIVSDIETQGNPNNSESAFAYVVRTVRGSSLRAVAACIGLASLWVCLQASGFYPLSLLGNVGECTADTVAHYHVVYTVALIAFAACGMAFGNRIRPLLFGRLFGLAAGIAGVLGHVFLVFTHAGETPSVAVVAGVVLVAFFIASSTLFWMERVAGNDNGSTILLIALSYLLSQFASAVFYAVGLPQAALIIVCCVSCAVCAAIVGEGNPLDAEQEAVPTTSIRKLPWLLLVPTLFLIYFCEIFIRMRLGEFSGDASMARKLITSVIAGGAFSLVVIVLLVSRKQDTQRSLIATFAVLVVVYLIALLIMLLFDSSMQTMTSRVLIACSHCVEVFLWLLVLNAVNEQRISPTSAYGFMLIVAVAVPWAISFDAYYLLGLDQVIGAHDILVPGTAVALAVTAVGTIAVLMHYMLANSGLPQQKAAPNAQPMPQRKSVRSALEPFGLTNREFEVAEYLYRGYSAKRIAEILFLSEASIRAYTMHVYRKMDIHSKQELINYIDEDA